MVFQETLQSINTSKIFYVIFAIQWDFLISLIVRYAYFRLKC